MKKLMYTLILGVVLLYGRKVNGQDQFFCPTPSNTFDILSNQCLTLPWVLPACFRVAVHIMQDDNGENGMSIQEVQKALNILSGDYRPYGIHFIVIDIDEIKSDFYLNYDPYASKDEDKDGDGKFDNFSPNSHNNAIDIYFYPNNKLNYGYAAGIPSTAFVIGGMFRSFVLATLRPISHEMGHCLGLYHTFRGALCVEDFPGTCPEFVNGNNCCTCGDYVCDTPADPVRLYSCSNGCSFDPFNCFACGEFTNADPNGQPYNPDPHLIMSYAHPNCLQYHTQGQITRINNVINLSTALQNCLSSDGMDLYVKDAPLDFGMEPNPDNGPMWISDDIWNRLSPDGKTTHVNPEYKAGSPNLTDANYIYVRVYNKGCSASLGTEELKVYWAKASTGLSWPTQWVSYTPMTTCTAPLFGDEITNDGSKPYPLNSSPVLIPVLQPGAYIDIPVPWWPPDPADFSCFGADFAHFCILARIETPASEGSNIYLNVKNNNNIAWKNITIVDLFPTNTPKKGQTIVRNVYDEPVLTTFAFNVPPAEVDNSFLDYGTVKIWLGDSLFQRWVDGGYEGDGIEICDDTLIHILSPDAWVGNIALDTGEFYVVTTIFDQYVFPYEQHTSNFDIVQYDSLLSDTTLLTGGVRFAINAFSLNRLTLPDSLHENPTLSVCCGDTLLFTYPDTMLTGLSASFRHWLDEESEFSAMAAVAVEEVTGSAYSVSHSVLYFCNEETETYMDVEVACSINPTFIRIVMCGDIQNDTLELKTFSEWISDSLVLLITDTCYNGDSLNCNEEQERLAQKEFTKAKGDANVDVYPNPTTGMLNIRFNSESEAGYHMTVTDITGRVLISESMKAAKGDNLKELDVSRFTKGLYFVIVRSDSISKMVRLMKE